MTESVIRVTIDPLSNVPPNLAGPAYLHLSEIIEHNVLRIRTRHREKPMVLASPRMVRAIIAELYRQIYIPGQEKYDIGHYVLCEDSRADPDSTELVFMPFDPAFPPASYDPLAITR